MSKDKGIDSFISVFPQVLKSDPYAHLVLVGINANERDTVEKICARAGLEKGSYTIVSHLPHKESIPYVQSSDVLIMNYPNIEHFARFMSPLKMFEYMASGNAIVASRLPSIEEVLDDSNSVLFEPGDSASLCAAIIRAIRDPELSQRIGKKAQADAAAYSWSNRARHIMSSIIKK